MNAEKVDVRYDNMYGTYCYEKGWVPAPRYLLRRERILSHMANQPVGSVLEVGCGAGALLIDLQRQGHFVQALENSAQAMELGRSLSCGNLTLSKTPQPEWLEKFEYVMAFEVLEHIENDIGALESWVKWMQPGGQILLSVPAHMSKWSPSDVWAGHFRRYSRAEIISLATHAGLVVNRIESYGFPLANIIAPLRARVHARQMQTRKDWSIEKNTQMSGIDRHGTTRFFPLLQSLPGRLAIRIAYAIQRFTINFDWGDGYFLVATKPYSPPRA